MTSNPILMNEAETRAEHIDPALRAAGWGVVEGSRIHREYEITKVEMQRQQQAAAAAEAARRQAAVPRAPAPVAAPPPPRAPVQVPPPQARPNPVANPVPAVQADPRRYKGKGEDEKKK